jgi:hypothetical protein
MSHRAVKYRVTLTTAEPNKPSSGRNPPPLIYYGAPIIVARLCNVNGTTVMHASNPTRFVPVASAHMRGMKTRPLWQKPVQSSLNVCGLQELEKSACFFTAKRLASLWRSSHHSQREKPIQRIPFLRSVTREPSASICFRKASNLRSCYQFVSKPKNLRTLGPNAALNRPFIEMKILI